MKYYHISKELKSNWQKKILNWYSINKRNLPWRERNNQKFYNIWISEIMLQQTQVKTVVPYYNKFIKKWPNLESFFEASLEEILTIWQGLGYYQRAKNLFLAKEILKKTKIKIEPNELKKLPGIGDYVSSAICAILLDKNCTVIDSNIKRIISRAFGLEQNQKKIEPIIRDIATKLTPKQNNKFYCQSLMDLANIICRSKKPNCLICPVSFECDSSGKVKKKNKEKIEKIKKIGITYVMRYKNYVLLEKSENKILQNLYCFPLTRFESLTENSNENILLEKIDKEWKKKNLVKFDNKYSNYIKHTFSHFHLKLFIIEVNLKNKNKFKKFGWILDKNIENKPSSTLMKKIKMEVFC